MSKKRDILTDRQRKRERETARENERASDKCWKITSFTNTNVNWLTYH